MGKNTKKKSDKKFESHEEFVKAHSEYMASWEGTLLKVREERKESETYYVEGHANCSPFIRQFRSYEEALVYCVRFYMDRNGAYDREDFWIDRIFKGQVLMEE